MKEVWKQEERSKAITADPCLNLDGCENRETQTDLGPVRGMVVTYCWAPVGGWGRVESRRCLSFQPENWKWNRRFLTKGEQPVPGKKDSRRDFVCVV